MSKIEAIVFDFDGVIVDSEPLYEKAERELFAQYGIEIEIADLNDTKGLSEEMYWGLIRERYKVTAPMEEMIQKGRELLKNIFMAELGYVSGFLDFFAEIEPRIPTGLATSSSRDLLNWIFANTSVRNHFRYSVTADDVAYSKPHPEPYRKICQLIDTRPENTIVIEDSANGLRSAKAAGTITIGFAANGGTVDFTDADYTAADYQQVAALISAINEERKAK